MVTVLDRPLDSGGNVSERSRARSCSLWTNFLPRWKAAIEPLRGVIQEVGLEKKSFTVRGSIGQAARTGQLPLGAKLVVKTVTLSFDDKTVIEAKTYQGEVAGRPQYHVAKQRGRRLIARKNRSREHRPGIRTCKHRSRSLGVPRPP